MGRMTPFFTLLWTLLLSGLQAQMTGDSCEMAGAERCEKAVQEAMLKFQTDLELRLERIEKAYVGQLEKLMAASTETGCTPTPQVSNKACVDEIATYSCGVSHFDVINCPDTVPLVREDTYFSINGAGTGTWPSAGFCTIKEPSELCGDDYEVSVEMNNFYGEDLFFDNGTPGSLGLMYNMRADDSFDYVYFRPHTSDACYQIGHIQDGTNNFDTSSPCPSPVIPKAWFKVRLLVTPSQAKIYVDGHLVVTATPNFPIRGRAGVILINGNNNMVNFKNFRMAKR